MARSYKFAIVRFAPDELRGERVNIGALIFLNDRIDVRLTKRMDKVRAISGSVEIESLNRLTANFDQLDMETRQAGQADVDLRHASIGRLGPLSLSSLGQFVAENLASYEEKVARLLTTFVEPDPAPSKPKPKRTRLFAELKSLLRREQVLAKTTEGLESHRLVPAYAVDDGLTADLVLKNGIYHVIETVDASGDEHSFRKAISDIAVSALVLERARMKFGETQTASRVVYKASGALERVARPSLDAAAHQGSELVNWESLEERRKLLMTLVSLATPLEDKKKRKRPLISSGGDLFH